MQHCMSAGERIYVFNIARDPHQKVSSGYILSAKTRNELDRALTLGPSFVLFCFILFGTRSFYVALAVLEFTM